MMNNCTFIGRLVNNPTQANIQYDLKSATVCNFVIAINRRFRRSDNTLGDHVDFIECEAWDAGGQMIFDNFKKGNWIILHCSAKNHKIKVKTVDGDKEITTTKFRVNSFDFPQWKDDTRKKNDDTVADE